MLTRLHCSYAALGLAESFSVTSTPAATAQQTQTAASTNAGAPLPPGRGRIIRDADGNVLRVELPQEPDDDASEPSSAPLPQAASAADGNSVVQGAYSRGLIPWSGD